MSQWVGIFDSGVGGLTVARAIAQRLPEENLAYLGDTARVPYGIRSAQTVKRYVESNVTFLQGLGLKALVIACNTASAVAADGLEQRLGIPVFGVVGPGARLAATRSGGEIAVLATETTVRTQAYPRAIQAHSASREVRSLACPLFVPLAEEGWVQGQVPELIARQYLAPLAGSNVDTLVLGCTHYPLLQDVIVAQAQDVLKRTPTVIDSAGAVAEELAERLGPRTHTSVESGARTFYVTDGLESFKRLAPRFFGAPVTDVQLVDVIPS